jgi:hypothetical protein
MAEPSVTRPAAGDFDELSRDCKARFSPFRARAKGFCPRVFIKSAVAIRTACVSVQDRRARRLFAHAQPARGGSTLVARRLRYPGSGVFVLRREEQTTWDD